MSDTGFIRLIASLVAVACTAGTAIRGQVPSSAPLPQFRSEVRYVEVDVFVTDRAGTFVRDLTREDFELIESGRPQTITDFRFVDLPLPAAPEPPEREPAVPADVATNVGERRAYVLLIEPGETVDANRRTQNIAHQLVRELLGPNDMMAVVHAQGSTSHAQAFTSVRALLHRSIDELPRSVVYDRFTDCAPIRNRVSYRAIEDLAERLGAINGRRKAIIWLNARIPFDLQECAPTLVAWHLDALRAATRNNVAIYPINPIPSPVGLSPYVRGRDANGQAAMQPVGSGEEIRRSGALRAVAEDTGGIAVVDTNNFSPAFASIARDNSTYYLLGYYPTTDWRDGEFHPITVRVRRPGLTVRARRGYYAPAPDTAERAPSAVADGLAPDAARALRSPLPTSGLTMTVFATPFKGPDATGSVLLGAHLHGPDLALDADDQVVLSPLTIDTRGTITPGPRSTFTLYLRDATRNAVREAGFSYVERLALPPGRHEVRLMAHQPGGATGAVIAHVEVPNYARGPLHLSGIVLSSEHAAAHRALRTDDVLDAVLPAGPTALRRFTPDDTLTAFAEVYTERRTRPDEVRLTTTLTRAGGAQVRAAGATRVRSEPGVAAYTVALPLAGLAPGDYIVTLEARVGRRTAARQVPFAVAAAD